MYWSIYIFIFNLCNTKKLKRIRAYSLGLVERMWRFNALAGWEIYNDGIKVSGNQYYLILIK